MRTPRERVRQIEREPSVPDGETERAVSSSVASINGVDLGVPAPPPVQDRLGDFAIPQRGFFVIGRAFFAPFDGACHPARTAGADRATLGVPAPAAIAA